MDYRNKPLAQADRFHLNAASGWLGLGDLDSANHELEQISPEMQEHPAVLLAQCEIYHAAKTWQPLLSLTEKLLKQLPKLDLVWINRSYALHELTQTEEAFNALLPAVEIFPKRWLIRYNLACYCSQLGRSKEAMQWLKQAIDLGNKKEIKVMALDDPDFKPLWKEISTI